MRKSALVSALFVVTWICAAEGFIIGAALALGGLAALKGAALVGLAVHKHKKFYRHNYYHRPYYHGRSYYHGYPHGYHYGYVPYKGYRKGRSVGTSMEEYGEDLLLSTVAKLDPNGCIMKLLCHSHIKEESQRSLEEAILVDMFSNSSDTLSSSNAAFVFATDIGVKTRDPSACKKYFPNCPLNEEQLSNLLQMAWGSAFDFLEDSEEEIAEGETTQEIGQVAEQEVPATTDSQVSLMDILKEKVSS